MYLSMLSINFLLGFIPLYINYKNISNILFSLWIFIMNGWIISNYMIFNSNNILFWNKTAYIFATIGVSFLFLFIINYPQNRISLKSKIGFFFFSQLIINLSLIISPYLIISMNSLSEITFGNGHIIWVILFLSLFISTIYYGFNETENLDQNIKKTLKIISIGFILFILISFTCNLIIPVIFKGASTYKFGPLAALIYNSVIIYCILKNQLLNIKVLISKIVASTLSFIIIFLIIFTTHWILHQLIEITLWIIYTANTLFLITSILLYDKLRVKLQSTTEKLFLKGTYDYKQVMLNFSSTSNFNFSINSLHKKIESFFINELEFAPITSFFPQFFETQKNTSSTLISNKMKLLKLTQSQIKVLQKTKNSFILIKKIPDKILELNQFRYALIIKNKNTILGIIAFGEKLSEEPIYQDDIQLLNTISNQIETFLNQIKQARITSQIEIAQTIQQEIIPKTITLPNCNVTTCFESSDEVGGDYYDTFSNKIGNWVILGDVSGHGVGSGVVMFMVQSIFNTLINECKLTSPAQLNKSANKILCQNFNRLKEPRPMTIATLYTKDGKKFIYHGSHETFFIYNAKKNTITHKPLNDIPFGLGLIDELDEKLFIDHEINLEKNDMLILCTDGIIEAMNEKKEEFGETRLIEIINKNKHKPINDIRDLIINKIKLFSNNNLDDDFSMIIIQSELA
jgi:serine phosphatase RsbU (regulator of sigma subunit)